jgi:EpsD family peptidyl-prolyl cis-trans isomerase
MNVRVLPAVLVSLLALLSAGCGSGTPEGIAARVNGKEIPARRVQAVAMPGEPAARALERVIDQELLVQAALNARLQRDPQVVQALEDARRRVLAQAYVDRTTAGAGDDHAGQVKEFYEAHPALFAHRRVYRFQELAVEGPTEKLGLLREQVRLVASMDELAAWLRSRNLPFSLASATKPAEQVPLNMLPRLADMKDGQFAVFATPTGASVVRLVQSQEAALSENEATPVIEKYLASRRRMHGVEAALGQLRSMASVEVSDEYRGRQELRKGLLSRAPQTDASSSGLNDRGFADGVPMVQLQ